MKTRVDVLASDRKESVYEGGRKSVRFVCQCVCYLPTGVQVGEAVVPESLAPKDSDGSHYMPSGSYEFEYGLNVNWQTKKLEGQLKSLVAIGRGAGMGGNTQPVSPAMNPAPKS